MKSNFIEFCNDHLFCVQECVVFLFFTFVVTFSGLSLQKMTKALFVILWRSFTFLIQYWCDNFFLINSGASAPNSCLKVGCDAIPAQWLLRSTLAETSSFLNPTDRQVSPFCCIPFFRMYYRGDFEIGLWLLKYDLINCWNRLNI